MTCLAIFFDVTVDVLSGEAPLSLWQYASDQPHYSKPCIGREIELSQLQHFLSLANLKQTTVCIKGMRGVGKTHLVHHFLSLLHNTNKSYLYFGMSGAKNALSKLTRLMLDIDDTASDEIVKERIKRLSVSFLLKVYLGKLFGIRLNETEMKALEGVSSDRLEIFESQAVTLLLQQCIARGIKVIAIDNLHEMQQCHCTFIQKLTHDVSPYLLLLSATNITQFTYVPDWLFSANHIDLKCFDSNEMTQIANVVVKTNAMFSSYQHNLRWKKSAVDRSHGHPAILEALLFQDLSSDFSNTFHQATLSDFQALSIEQRQLLKVLATIGQSFSINIIDLLLSHMLSNELTQLHYLVCSGFLLPMFDGYCFQHRVIRDIVKEQMTGEEHQHWKTFFRELCSKE